MSEKQLLMRADLATSPELITKSIELNGGLPRYFRVDTSGARRPRADLMKLALDDSAAKRILVALANLGYVLYFNVDNESRFIRLDRVRHHWRAVKQGKYECSQSGIVHRLEKPDSGRAERLLVVMSPIGSTPRFSRFFRTSFGTLMKYIAPNTAILRIADVGGVKGAFYMDTTALPQNSANVHALIRGVAHRLSVSDDRIVLYGASKGGSGALFHGLSAGWKFVSVDPIVSDEWYELHKRDYHFTSGGIFPSPKQDVFGELVSEVSRNRRTSTSSVIVTSSRSPQYRYISETLVPMGRELTILNSRNTDINSHPDVAPKTIYSQVMALNALLIGKSIGAGETSIP